MKKNKIYGGIQMKTTLLERNLDLIRKSERLNYKG